MSAPEIFDRHARRLRRGRVIDAPEAFFTGLMIDELIDRLDLIKRTFSHALVVGAEPRLVTALQERAIAVTIVDPSHRRAMHLGGTAGDEDAPMPPTENCDLVVACGTLDTVSDLPGALMLLRRTLRPDGLFLGIFPGAPSLPTLRAAVARADSAQSAGVARFHPQVDVRSAGDLLVRAGFALPVSDRVDIDLRYRDVGRLLDDLKQASMRNVLAQRFPVGQRWRESLSHGFRAMAEPDGRTCELLSLIVLTGWAPAPSQPQPARRGSATASLAAALKQRPEDRD